MIFSFALRRGGGRGERGGTHEATQHFKDTAK